MVRHQHYDNNTNTDNKNNNDTNTDTFNGTFNDTNTDTNQDNTTTTTTTTTNITTIMASPVLLYCTNTYLKVAPDNAQYGFQRRYLKCS